MDESLPKSERLCGKKAVEDLFAKGKSLTEGCLKLRFLERADAGEPSRMMVSVPKRNFKRAVRRNLLKRRIRESYRRQKALAGGGKDFLFVYLSREVQPYDVIFADMTALLTRLA
ncbi:MAG: ribonuclease P protein component [Bacteroidales bacterium]|nr:ribonuclease P protein component [Bacteroidales bacterium]